MAIYHSIEYVSIMNPAQTLTAIDWAVKTLDNLEATVWHNFRGLLDVVGYLGGRIGPLSPLYHVQEVLTPIPAVGQRV